MRLEYAPHFQRNFVKLPKGIQNKFEKQVAHLSRDIHYPSLRAKKYDEGDDIWQARVDDHYRFYFQIRGDCYTLLRIEGHKD